MGITDTKGTSWVFWVLWLGLASIGSAMLFYQGWHKSSFAMMFAGLLFFAMGSFSVIISSLAGMNLFKQEKSWSDSSIGFTIGFVFMAILSPLLDAFFSSIGTIFASGTASVPSSVAFSGTVSNNILLSGLSNQLPISWYFFVNTVTAAVNEEAFFAVGFIIIVIAALLALSEVTSDIFINPVVLTTLVTVAVVPAFISIHSLTGGAIVIATLITFRAPITFLLWGDMEFNLIPYIAIMPSFLVGAHLGNNFVAFGIFNSLTIMTTTTVGQIVLLVLSLTVASGLITGAKRLAA